MNKLGFVSYPLRALNEAFIFMVFQICIEIRLKILSDVNSKWINFMALIFTIFLVLV